MLSDLVLLMHTPDQLSICNAYIIWEILADTPLPLKDHCPTCTSQLNRPPTLVHCLPHEDEHGHDTVAIIGLNGSVQQSSLIAHRLEPLQAARLFIAQYIIITSSLYIVIIVVYLPK